MTKQTQDYQDLLSFLLGPLRERPGMYLGEPKISKLVNFISGYMICLGITNNDDKYFDNPGFLSWLYKKYNLDMTSYWIDPFLKEANGDEKKALQLYFNYLEEYSKSISEQINKM